MRFPEFEDEWEAKKLNDIGEYYGGGTPDTSNKNFWTGTIPWISSSDIQDENILSIVKSRFITQEAIEKSATKLIPKGSILMVSRVGIGKFAIADEDLCTSQDFTNLATTENEFFLGYYFTARANRFIRLSQGTSIKGFTTSDIKTAKFLIPIKEEQSKVASFLKTIDERISTQNKIIEHQESLIKGLMQQIFTQQLRFKANNGSSFPDWQEKKLGKLFQIGSGRDYKLLQHGNVPVYGTGGYMTSVNDYLYEGESVGIGRKGTIDKPVFLTNKFWTVDTLFYTHSFKDVIPYFVFLLFKQINWLKYNEASGVPSLSKSTIEKIKVKIPIVDEQKKIVDLFSSMNIKIENERSVLEQYKQQKKHLLQKLFI